MISADQIRAGRALANLSVKELADRVGIGVHAIKRLENGKTSVAQMRAANIEGLQRELEKAGIVFLADGYGVTKRQEEQ